MKYGTDQRGGDSTRSPKLIMGNCCINKLLHTTGADLDRVDRIDRVQKPSQIFKIAFQVMMITTISNLD